MAIHAVFAVVTLYDSLVPSLCGLELTLTGLIYYRWIVLPEINT